jgi:catechol 2,3-dioxygenase
MEKPRMTQDYEVPPGVHIGHVHLKVADIKRSLDFYCGLLGFKLVTTYGEQAAFVAAGNYHHHIGLNTWYSKNAEPAPLHHAGLFHVAILYPQRKDLAKILRRIQDAGYALSGASDHGVSEALYLTDPDRNGLELYWDKPRDAWPKKADGSIDMVTHALDLEALLAELY